MKADSIRKPSGFFRGASTCVLTALWLAAPTVRADDWNVATGDWFVGGNWLDGSVPTAFDNAYIDNGGTSQILSAGALALYIYVGDTATGYLQIFSGGTVSDTRGYVGYDTGSSGAVTVDGAGSAWTNSDRLYVGFYGSGSLAITDGGTVISDYLGYVGFYPGSSGAVTVDGAGSAWTNGVDLVVGYVGTGSLAITDGGTVSDTWGHIGYLTGSSGAVTVDGAGSAWTNSGGLILGNEGTGSLAITGGGTVSGIEGYVGLYTGGAVTVTVDGAGSAWTNSGGLILGNEGSGSLAITGGGTVSDTNGYVGRNVGGNFTVTVDGTGSAWINSGVLVVGNSGSGGLAITDGGTVSANSGLTLANLAGSNGTLNIGSGGAAGILDSATVNGGGGTATLNFNHNDPGYYFTNTGTSAGTPIATGGSTAVNQLGSGTTVLNGTNTHTGDTTVNAGTLITQNAAALGAGPVSLNGGTLAATGPLNILSMAWDGGLVALAPAAGDVINVTTAFNNGGVAGEGGAFQIDPQGFTGTGTYTLVNFATTDFTLGQFSAVNPNPNVQYTGSFLLNPNSVQFSLTGATATGAILQNSAPVNIPTFANFLVNGPVTTGTPAENNTINSLTFNPGSSLQVFNNLTVTGGDFTVNSGRAVINGGRIIVPGDFNKNGGGTLVANTHLQVGGNANINRGALFVNSTLEADRVNVFHGALLGGDGVIFADVFNSGTVAPGNSPGTLTIIGNYTQTSRGTLRIEIASPTVFDRLVVSGTARLDGTLDIRNHHGNTLSYGQQVPFLQAGRIVGTFDEILMPEADLFRGRFLNAGQTGILLVAPTSYTLVAETPNQTRVAEALDHWIGTEEGDIGAVTLALDLLAADQYPSAFEAIMPGYYEAVLNTGIELSQNQGQLLNQQLSSRRLGQRSAPAVMAYDARPPDQHSAGKGGKNVVAPAQEEVAAAEDTHWNGWMQGSGLFSEGGLSLNPGEDFESGTFMAGADYGLGEHFAVGLFASYQEGWGDYANGGNIDLESVRFGGYATVDFGGFYANAAVGGGTTGYDVRRPIQWATLDRTARSNPDGTEFFTLLGTGYDFHAGNLTFGPSLSAQYTKLKLDGFTEQGAGSLDLSVGDAEEESLRTYLGGRVAYTLKVNDKLTLIPELRAFWQHEYLQGGESLRASLDGGSGPGFNYVTGGPGEDAVYAGAGLNFVVGENFTTGVYYHANFGRNDDVQHTVSVNVNCRF